MSACRGPEDVLVAAWFGLRFARAALRTVEGEEVRVVSAGVRNPGGGPDFRGARLVLGGREIAGEVELHRDTADWARHGHDRDAHYDGVVLHVSLSAAAEVVTSSGRRVPRLVVTPYGDPPEARRRVPAATAEAGVGPCHAAPAARLLGALERFGLERLERRAARFASWAREAGPEEAAWRGLSEAMGYGANYEAFRALAFHVPWNSFAADPPGPARAETIEAALLDASGLFPADPGDAESRVRLLRLHAALRPGRPEAFGPAAWRSCVRPPDAPVRRFAALAALAARESPAALVARCAGDPAAAPRALLVPPLPYWNLRAAWGPPSFRRPLRLLGNDRALAAASSALLPLVLALHPDRADAARRQFLALPTLPEDHVTRYMRFRIFAHPAGRRLSAARQQGLHHLYRAGCALGRAGCPRCELPRQASLPQIPSICPPPPG
ncbi:MAG: DUF2851 family protein [Planctomycetes bacterium]|nr:DUF2851 family protein [Planctomycetota bacterium]